MIEYDESELRQIILIVEDNADDEALMLRTLRKLDVKGEIVVVRDGEEALDYLFGTGKWEGRDLKVMPICVFLDLKLPKIGGLDVLKKIRENKRTKLLPVIVVTSSDEEHDVFWGYELGANSYVCKPVDFLKYV